MPAPEDPDELSSVDDPHQLLSAEAKARLSDLRDADANRRDLKAEVRDRYAEVRDHNARVRDDTVSAEPDLRGHRRRAAKDRKAAAVDRAAADDDRQHAHDDREVSRWDRSVAAQREAALLKALNDSDDLAESTLLIGRAQGALIHEFGGGPTDALIELGDRASHDHVGLQEAARRIIAESHDNATEGNQDRPTGRP